MKRILNIFIISITFFNLYTFIGCNKKVDNITLSVINGETIFYITNISSSKSNVYDLLVEIDKNYENFYFEGNNSEYGFYITSICGIEETISDNKMQFWAFYIDGDYARTGISSQKLYNNINIEFKYEKFDY